EATHHASAHSAPQLSFVEVFLRTSWRDRNLLAVCQAGLVNNLNDGMAWGLLPLYFAARGLPLSQVSVLGALYPGVWGVAQLGTGALSDHIGRKGLIAAGMILQAAAIVLIILASTFPVWATAAILLG